jgi:uncharacterized alpha-E superfamily protein
MLARVAEAFYWTAREVERADALAVALEVSHASSLESIATRNGVPGGFGTGSWEPLVELSSDLEEFRRTHREVDERTVSWFLTFGAGNPNSVIACVTRAREGARSARDRLPTELWESINSFYLELAEWPAGRIAREGIYTFCERVRRNVALIHGVTSDAVRRDAGWQFMRLGRFLERGDRTARLLQVAYGSTPSRSEAGASLDVHQWANVLRAASALEAYLQVEPSDLSPEAISRFLIMDERSPRAIAFCLEELDRALADLVELEALVEGALPALIVGSTRDLVHAAAGLPWDEHLPSLLDRIRGLFDQIGVAITESCFSASYVRDHSEQHAQATRQAQN